MNQRVKVYSPYLDDAVSYREKERFYHFYVCVAKIVKFLWIKRTRWSYEDFSFPFSLN